MKNVYLFALVLLGSAANLLAERTDSIGYIISAPEEFFSKTVEIEGKAKSIGDLEDDSNFRFFKLQESSDISIRVKVFDTVPTKNKKYRVKGLLYESEEGPFVHANSLSCQNCKEEEEAEISPVYWIIGGAILLAFILAMLIKASKKKKKVTREERARPGSAPSYPPSGSSPAPGGGGPPGGDFSTVSFNMNEIPSTQDNDRSAKPSTANTADMNREESTVRFIRGSFKIKEGSEVGRELRILGRPSSIGQVSSIGRGSDKENSNSHIALNDPTVSRRQAEIREHQGKIYIKNLSSTNPTAVGGKTLSVGEERIIESGTLVSMGNIVLEYNQV